MSIPIQKFRELVFQMLYSYNLGHGTEEEILELLSKELSLTKKVVREAQVRVRAILSHLDTIDAQITNISLSYAFERIQTVEKNILRLGVYELFYDPSIPAKVVIAEAKRLAKKFSTQASASFVHALLDAAYQLHVGKQVDQTELVKSVTELEQCEQLTQQIQKELIEKMEKSDSEPSHA